MESDDVAAFARVAYPNDEVELAVEAGLVGSGLDPALGFVPRRGIKRYAGAFEWFPRLHTSIRRLGGGIYPELVTDPGNDPETVRVFAQPLRVEWETGDELRLEVVDQKEVLAADFEIHPGTVIPARTYDWTEYALEIETSDKRALDLEVGISAGAFYDGRRADQELSLGWRPGAGGTLGLDFERNAIDLPGGEFEVHLARTRLDLQFGPDLAWRNFLQWDDESDLLGLNSRLWWIPRPGHEVFFVLNRGWTADSEGIAPGDQQVILKVGTSFRF
ncbi:MAG: hypothetical protein AB1726_11795 [Planctomycetota bacterium]